MRIIKNPAWVFYLGDTDSLIEEKTGKWMYFFDGEKGAQVASEMCNKSVQEDVVVEAKHSNSIKGVACFYLNCDDMGAHKKIIEFFISNGLIAKTKTGKYYNISFKLDAQTGAGEYGSDFSSDIKLSNFIDLYTGEWVV
ncbi:hypothetical protein LJC04_04520 [Ruminococcaceae bacterium OttesenSCG-928-O06]|nr:hypothetical protein [Ruminococcaceae bacterium OttesenSCG-928-O06]